MPNGQGDDKAMAAALDAARVFAAVTARAVSQVADEVTLPQLRVLVLAATRTPNASEVAAELGVLPSSASRLCDRLVRAGLLDRRDDPEDRRQVQLRTTAAGRRLLDAVTESRRAQLAPVLDQLGPAQRRDLAEAFRLFAAAANGLDPRLHRVP